VRRIESIDRRSGELACDGEGGAVAGVVALADGEDAGDDGGDGEDGQPDAGCPGGPDGAAVLFDFF
jgi:hypothetical protein